MLRVRILYVAFLAFAIYLGIYKDGFVSTMLFYMSLTIPLASIGHMVLTYMQFRLSETLEKQAVVKGDSVIYRYTIDNHSKFVFCPMQVHYAESELLFKDSSLASDDVFVLYPNESKVVEKVVDCRFRGFYYIGIDYIYISDFLNIFRIKFRVSDHQKILVYPLIRDLSSVQFPKTVFEEAESIHSADLENAKIFSDVREYRSGDSMRHIHWKLSSKKNQLMTKEFEGSISNRTTIMMNVDGLSFGYEENVVFQDYIIEGAVAVIRYLLDNSASVDLISYKTNLQRVHGQNKVAFDDFYEHLARMMFSQHSFEKQLIRGHLDEGLSNSQVMIFTPYITKTLCEDLLSRNCSDKVLMFVVDPKEHNLTKSFEQIDLSPMYRMIAAGFNVYKINFEHGLCRLEVA